MRIENILFLFTKNKSYFLDNSNNLSLKKYHEGIFETTGKVLVPFTLQDVQGMWYVFHDFYVLPQF